MRSTFDQINKYLLRIECERNENAMHKYLSIGRDAIIFGYPVRFDQVLRGSSGMWMVERMLLLS